MSLPITEHPLKAEVRRLRLALWEVSYLLGGQPDEPMISRYLRGTRPMPPDVEERLRAALAKFKEDMRNELSS
jgi:hypothetical protein